MELNEYIDHTLLKPEANEQEIIALCDEARTYRFASVCVHPYWVSLCAERLSGEKTRVATVVGFPLGATTTEAKAFETAHAINNGAREIDMVINIGALKGQRDDWVTKDIEAVVHAARPDGMVKVILETSLLTDEEIVKGCRLAANAGAHYVKTSTGFGARGATVEHVRLMKETVGSKARVKASGGIRDYETAMAMIKAGADRIGTSSGVAILKNTES